MPPDEPRTLTLAAAAVAADLDAELLDRGTEDDLAFLVRVGAHYLGETESWDGDPYRGELRDGAFAGFTLAWPAPWGAPQLADGRWRWETRDAIFTLTVIHEVDRIPTAEGWMNMRREELAGTAWTVIGGRACTHALGRAAELAEARTSRPRALRVTRSAWSHPTLVSLGVETRVALSRERARELATTFGTLRRAR